MVAYTYPRLDMEVSKKMNHLLKVGTTPPLPRAVWLFLLVTPPLPVEVQAPFCVHPKTGKVCVPIDPESAWEFDPDCVCTVGGLLNQLNMSSTAAAQVRCNRWQCLHAGVSDYLVGMQAEEAWQVTDMRPAVDTFRTCFLNALHTDVKAQLAEKSRQAAAQPTLAW